MPRAEEVALLREAKRRHYGKKRTNAFVFGTLYDQEHRARGGGTAMAHRKGLRGILSGFWGRRSRYKTRKNRSANGSERTLVESHLARRTGLGRRSHAAALRRNATEARHERMVYVRKEVRGGWGRGYAKTKTGQFMKRNGEAVPYKAKIGKLTAEEKKEEARIAARRRYLKTHPNAKTRFRLRAGTRGFL